MTFLLWFLQVVFAESPLSNKSAFPVDVPELAKARRSRYKTEPVLHKGPWLERFRTCLRHCVDSSDEDANEQPLKSIAKN